MQPLTKNSPVAPPINETKPLQNRLRRFIRQPDKLQARHITPKALAAVAIIERYRFVPTSMLVRLLPGDQKYNHRPLQTLFHKGYVNRFCLPKYGGPGEFIYYLDSADALKALIEAGLLPQLAEEERSRKLDVIKNNRQAHYDQLHRDPESIGKVLYIQHELMVSRFHFLLEMACRKLSGKAQLEQWKQGTELWNRVQAPKISQDHDSGVWLEHHVSEMLPHRPDAFFTLYFPGKPEDQRRSHFFYEADRGRETTTKYKLKLRAHWQFVVKHRLQRTAPCYNVPAIRAVLTETKSLEWKNKLREAACHPIVSPKPSPLFWFTSLEKITQRPSPKQPPIYLEQPEWIFNRIWEDPTPEERFFHLAH